MYFWIFAGAVAGAVIGFMLGRRGALAGDAHQYPTPVDFADPEEVEAFGRKGRAAVNERTEKRKARIMEKARAEGRITNDGVEELFCISDRTATVYLSALVEEGRLERSGTGRGTMYTPR